MLHFRSCLSVRTRSHATDSNRRSDDDDDDDEEICFMLEDWTSPSQTHQWLAAKKKKKLSPAWENEGLWFGFSGWVNWKQEVHHVTTVAVALKYFRWFKWHLVKLGQLRIFILVSRSDTGQSEVTVKILLNWDVMVWLKSSLIYLKHSVEERNRWIKRRHVFPLRQVFESHFALLCSTLTCCPLLYLVVPPSGRKSTLHQTV